MWCQDSNLIASRASLKMNLPDFYRPTPILIAGLGARPSRFPHAATTQAKIKNKGFPPYCRVWAAEYRRTSDSISSNCSIKAIRLRSTAISLWSTELSNMRLRRTPLFLGSTPPSRDNSLSSQIKYWVRFQDSNLSLCAKQSASPCARSFSVKWWGWQYLILRLRLTAIRPPIF